MMDSIHREAMRPGLSEAAAHILTAVLTTNFVYPEILTASLGVQMVQFPSSILLALFAMPFIFNIIRPVMRRIVFRLPPDPTPFLFRWGPFKHLVPRQLRTDQLPAWQRREDDYFWPGVGRSIAIQLNVIAILFIGPMAVLNLWSVGVVAILATVGMAWFLGIALWSAFYYNRMARVLGEEKPW
jgi:hypothetical protein